MGKYDHINFKPPKGVAEKAKQGLDWRKEHGRGGTDVGVARARDLSNRDNVSPETIGRMLSFFARHEKNKKAKGWDPGEDGYPSAGKISWYLWGGDPGWAWAKKIDKQMEAADKKEARVIYFRGAQYKRLDNRNPMRYATCNERSSVAMQVRFGFSISRIYDYFQGKPFAIISAYLSEDEAAERNEARADALKQEVRKLGYGYREIKGRWVEKEGPQAGQVLTEYPLFIPEISREDALYLASGEYFDGEPQYSIIYSDGENLYELRSDGAVEQEFTSFEANDLHSLWEYFSEYKGKPFRFGQVDMVTPPPRNPRGWAEHRAHYVSSEQDAHFYDHRRPSRLRQAVLDPTETLAVQAGGERDVRCYSVLSMPDRRFVGTKLIALPHRKPFRLSPKTAKVVKWAPYKFKSTYRIPESNARNWELHPRNLLLSRTEISEEPLERISWHPLTGEMILSAVGESYHAHDIHNHGSKSFDEYIRALVLPKKKRVVVRPWMPFTQMEMMRLEGDEADIVSFEGQDALRRVLESAGMPKSWTFEYDGDNRRLEKLTNRRNW